MKKILFVEDDELIRRIYTQKLAEAGFEVADTEQERARVGDESATLLEMLFCRQSLIEVARLQNPQTSGTEPSERQHETSPHEDGQRRGVLGMPLPSGVGWLMTAMIRPSGNSIVVLVAPRLRIASSSSAV